MAVAIFFLPAAHGAEAVSVNDTTTLVETAASIESDEALTLPEAISLSLRRNPRLEAFSWEFRASDARILQAGLRPNPELSVEIEEIGLGDAPSQRTQTQGIGGSLGSLPALSWGRERESGSRNLLDESEITLSIAQLIEVGGKRAKRVALAKSDKALIQWDYETARADVLTGVARAFVGVLVAQETVSLEEELLLLAKDVTRTIAARVKAGKVSPLDSNKAEIALAVTQIDMDGAKRDLAAARAALSVWWGATEAHFSRAEGDLDPVERPPALDVFTGEINANPDMARWASEILQREAVLTLERSQRKVDPTVSFGFRSTGVNSGASSGYELGTDGSFSASRSRGSYDNDRVNSLLLGISVPLPFFNRNQGRIAEAQALLSKGAVEQRAVRLNIHAALVAVWEEANSAFEALSRLNAEVLPRATETFEKTQRGYSAGKFSYLEVLDTQRTLFDARTTYLSRLAQFNRARVAIERLTGRSLAHWRSEDAPMDSIMTPEVIESNEENTHE
ncbi:MAG: TolC family protein [Candidatus Hydrogenedentes bacterium]|nr:TolC family protein [Candidatus Hydrogenedentota bacterium]